MFSRLLTRTAPALAKAVKPSAVPVRAFGGHSNGAHHDAHHGHANGNKSASDVVIPEFVDTLEWTLDCPPNLHEFTEPPVVVIIEHLENMKFEEH